MKGALGDLSWIRPNDLGIQNENSTTMSETKQFIEDTEENYFLGAKKGQVPLIGNQSTSRRWGPRAPLSTRVGEGMCSGLAGAFP